MNWAGWSQIGCRGGHVHVFSHCLLLARLIVCPAQQGEPRENDLLPPVGQERAIPQL